TVPLPSILSGPMFVIAALAASRVVMMSNSVAIAATPSSVRGLSFGPDVGERASITYLMKSLASDSYSAGESSRTTMAPMNPAREINPIFHLCRNTTCRTSATVIVGGVAAGDFSFIDQRRDSGIQER